MNTIRFYVVNMNRFEYRIRADCKVGIKQFLGLLTILDILLFYPSLDEYRQKEKSHKKYNIDKKSDSSETE